jgi:hypothetical protein
MSFFGAIYWMKPGLINYQFKFFMKWFISSPMLCCTELARIYRLEK